MDWVIGTANTYSVATAITVRVDKLSATPGVDIARPAA